MDNLVPHGDSGGIITPVFQPFEGVKENGLGLFIADVTDYSAHTLGLWFLERGQPPDFLAISGG